MAGNKVHDAKKCGATKKQGGGTCSQAAGWGTDHPGSGRCKLHGGASSGPKTAAGKAKTAVNAIKHGAYRDKILDDAEQDVYDALFDNTIDVYSLNENNAFHMATLHRACMSYLKTLRLDEWEMKEEWTPGEFKMRKGGIVRNKEGVPVIVSRPIYTTDGEYNGESVGSLRRIRWGSNMPPWETHFQKYMSILAIDRASEQKNKQAGQVVAAVVDGFSWLWGGSSEGGK